MAEAESAYRAALAIFERLAAERRDLPLSRGYLARTQNGLGNLLSETGRIQEAETVLRAAVRVQTQLAADFPAQADFR